MFRGTGSNKENEGGKDDVQKGKGWHLENSKYIDRRVSAFNKKNDENKK